MSIFYIFFFVSFFSSFLRCSLLDDALELCGTDSRKEKNACGRSQEVCLDENIESKSIKKTSTPYEKGMYSSICTFLSRPFRRRNRDIKRKKNLRCKVAKNRKEKLKRYKEFCRGVRLTRKDSKERADHRYFEKF